MKKIDCKKLANFFGLVLVWRLAVQLLFWISKTSFSLNPDISYEFDNPNLWINDLPNWLKSFANWDSGWYLKIASDGYEYIPETAANIVFFPLYPLLMRWLAWLMNNQYLLAGIILSHTFLILAIYFFYKLIKIDFSEKVAWRSVLYLLVFPVSFFLISVYTESLFLFLVILSFYLARKRKWLLTGIVGIFLSLTKPWGITICLPLLIEYLDQNNFKFKEIKADILWLGLPLLGLLSYMRFLKVKFGSYFLFVSSQTAWHDEYAFNFFKIITDYFNNIFINISDNLSYQTSITFDFSFFILALILSILVFFYVRKSYGVYALLATLIPAFSGIMVSMSRYILIIFPIFILLAKFGRKKIVNSGVMIIFTSLLAYFIILFVNNYWVA